jgi:hypothetical protein
VNEANEGKAGAKRLPGLAPASRAGITLSEFFDLMDGLMAHSRVVMWAWDKEKQVLSQILFSKSYRTDSSIP